MTSIFRDALGDEFERLHPKMQWRFGFSSVDGVAHIGHGTMAQVWRGPLWTLPFLLLGSTRRVLFPGRGTDIPFTIENYAYVDSFGRETVTFARRFRMRRRIRAFDATMIMSAQRGRVVDYLGTHQHLAVDLDITVDDRGGITLNSGDQRFYEGVIGFRFPMLFSGVAEVSEWWEEADQKFHIDVAVRNRRFGKLFGYRGTFSVTERPCSAEEIPIDVRPIREERRE
ncbi:DUF4166 domain-containing protein [Gordonia sp. CPCC 205333]|uniref:DUF4166 domain-containing protein n=1 Tax=Gordonia sp. CPCC 205333 TaxID=3140790 RepID=UPI003AF3C759